MALYVPSLFEALQQVERCGLAGGAEVVCHLAQARHRAVFHVKLPEERQQIFLAVGEGSGRTHGTTRLNHQARNPSAIGRAAAAQQAHSYAFMFMIWVLSLLAVGTMFAATF